MKILTYAATDPDTNPRAVAFIEAPYKRKGKTEVEIWPVRFSGATVEEARDKAAAHLDDAMAKANKPHWRHRASETGVAAGEVEDVI